jgi:hypothetical protein
MRIPCGHASKYEKARRSSRAESELHVSQPLACAAYVRMISIADE